MFPKSGATGDRASFATKAKEPTKEKEKDDTEEHFSGSTAGSSSSAVLLAKWKWPHLADIPVQTCKLEEVGLLIGMDHPASAEIF